MDLQTKANNQQLTTNMTTGMQFTGSLNPNETAKWKTQGWAPSLHVVWYIIPTSPQSAPTGAPQLEWEVAVERASETQCNYWFSIRNLTAANVSFEARYAILN
jgi:hypothetical protein